MVCICIITVRALCTLGVVDCKLVVASGGRVSERNESVAILVICATGPDDDGASFAKTAVSSTAAAALEEELLQKNVETRVAFIQ